MPAGPDFSFPFCRGSFHHFCKKAAGISIGDVSAGPFIDRVPFFFRKGNGIYLFFFFPPVVYRGKRGFRGAFDFRPARNEAYICVLFPVVVFSDPFEKIRFHHIEVVHPDGIGDGNIKCLFPFKRNVRFPCDHGTGDMFPFVLQLPETK